MINGRPSDFMNDFTKLLTAENTVKRYKTGKLTPAEQKRIEEKTKEIFPDEVIKAIAREASDTLLKALEDLDI